MAADSSIAAMTNALTPIRKFWLAWKTWVGGGRGLVRRLAQ